MKILLLVQKEQRVILDRLYDGIAAHADCDLRWLGRAEQANLRRYFRHAVDVCAYDRIVFFLRFKQEIRQVPFIRTVPNLVILEHDACQNYFPGKYQGKFSRHYAQLPWVRIISSGHVVAERLRAEGFDALFVPKGYDQATLRNLGLERDVELAFVGSTKSSVYTGRRRLLEEIAARENLLITRTESGDEYLRMLNRIRFFVSADAGIGEYMIKNFEAMACGCVLFAYDQGEAENEALGFRDMVNVVLYRDVEQLRVKLAQLRADPALAERIACAGQALVEREYRFDVLGRRVVEAMQAPLRPHPPLGWLDRLRLRLGVRLYADFTEIADARG
ncbi:glycosyltransferase family 1 protein [Pseudothauera nasutitermitis]|uniref:Glycosyltransferase family 1 protein n=1 Tax=Pseudothauera nasutitermitis TaxID=2565930 RepID=A0A4S4ATA7_9RHOO|nr:glycosyltransferase [Pseudothauera nasutitermitis]THF63133.1 glycosyltransferase family 1 protein [Pseudothauera nasutitermitis]